MKLYINKKSIVSTMVLLIISVLGFAQITPPPKFHDTKGKIEVTKSGQLQYTLDIDVPPGVKNISPNISLTYTSGGQNGIAGYNWNVAGLTSISRVGKNLERDGINKGVQLDYSDYYSFNGQRLILKSGEYGKDGAEYVTEKYSNIKIKSIGAITGQVWKGPEYWEVTFDDGSQAWYGASGQGASTIIDYNIKKLRDVNGNYITYTYAVDSNVTTISKIEWGGNETIGTAHVNKIEFNYDSRPKPETAYIKGILFSQSKILQSILVSSNNTQYKKYNLNYKKDLQETAYRYLDKITVLNSNNEEANPVTFTYEKSMNVPNPNIQSWGFPNVVNHNYSTDLFGDFDGDGRLDLIKFHSATSSTIPQVGIYLYRNFYHDPGESYPLVYLGNTINETELKNCIAVNLKKNNRIDNRQGFVSWKYANPSSTTSDIKLTFYGITDNNEIVQYYTKTIANADFDNSTGSTQNGIRTTVSRLHNVDLNGDGLSELVLKLNDKVCWMIDVNPAKLPHQCENQKRYILIDPDESIQNNNWFYELPLYTNAEEDAFTNYKAGDFNGDGSFDFIKIDQNKKPYIITFDKDSQGKYIAYIASFNQTFNTSLNGMWADGLSGDFNGDGVTDMMIPKSNDTDLWYLYTSTGLEFKEETRNFLSQYKNRTITGGANDNIYVNNPRTFVAFDINNDGKTEIISLQSGRFYEKEYYQDNPSQGTKYRVNIGSSVQVLATFGGGNDPLGSDNSWGQIVYLNQSNLNSALAVWTGDKVGLPVDHLAGAMLKRFALISMVPSAEGSYYLATHKYYDISMEGRIKSILQGGITTNISYKQLDKSQNPGLYNNVETPNYPYVEINQSSGMFVVSQLTQSTTSSTLLKQDFRYRGLTSNILGRGMIAFRKMARSSWYSDGLENTKIWSGVETDPLNDGVPVKEWSIRTNDESKIFPTDVSVNNTQLLSFKSTVYQIDKLINNQVVTTIPNTDMPKVVTVVVPKTTISKDFISNTVSENTVTYGQYYLPVQNISKVNNNFALMNSVYQYINNASGNGANYYIGRLQSKTDIIQAYSDTHSNKIECTYENNLLKTTKKWNRDNTEFVLETYSYNPFGNIVQRIINNSIDSNSEISETHYDPTGRFIIKKIDNLGLETNIDYNNWGQILTQADPLGVTVQNNYDNWGKLLSTESNTVGITTYNYTKDSDFNVTVTKSKPDGNVSISYTNKLGQVYKVSTKAFEQGKFVSQDTQYDVLGRKIKESEPYFEGQSASQWNTIVYDDSIYPAKVTATSFSGKKSATTVSGLTTTVQELNGYGRTTSKTTDALGNVISTTDKGGTVQFLYNAAGKQIQAKYAENVVTTKYDSWGRKSEFNDPSNGAYTYEYDGFGRTVVVHSPKGKKEFSYNSLGQLVSQYEYSEVDAGQTTDKTISFTYDNKGLLIGKSGTVMGHMFSSTYTYDDRARLISSVENSNERTFSHKDLIYNGTGRLVSYTKKLQSAGTVTEVTVENVYSDWNGELYQIKGKEGKILWQLKEANVKGQALKANLGAAEITNTYDTNGFLTNMNHSSAVKPVILQVSYSFEAVKNELMTRTTGGDFNIVEAFDYDDNNRLINWTDPASGVKPAASRNTYDIKGRILQNDDVGTIKFENPAKIYQPTSMTLNPSGSLNYDNDLVQKVVYNENNDPVFIDGEKGDVGFQYGLTGMRQMVTYGGQSAPLEYPENNKWQGRYTKYYNEDGSFEVIVDNESGGQEKHILYLEGSPYESNIVYLKGYEESKGSYKFLHKDYLGSILAITDEVGNKLEQRHFDAWGNLTHLLIGSGKVAVGKISVAYTIGAFNGLVVDRGYTGHEHFFDVGIIHMNGRLYDPLLRRFLNADENIQDPANTQNYNKYGYVMNNPMMYNDPDGEFWWWLAGAAAGGYLNGVQANGSWNPGKWNWERTWTAVLGGALGGAAISGALGNIVSNPGTIKTVLPGIVSGGLGSAFAGSNFLGGAIGGISYTGSLFDNRITSTEGVNSAYKYIISPDYNDGGEDLDLLAGYAPLTKELYAQYILGKGRRELTPYDQNYLGHMFEKVFIDWARLNIGPNVKDNTVGTNYLGVVPDAVSPIMYEGRYKSDGVFYEVKNTFNNIGVATAQIKQEMNALSISNLSRGIPVGVMVIASPSNISLTKPLMGYARNLNLELVQFSSFYKMNGSLMMVKFMTTSTINLFNTVVRLGGTGVPAYRNPN
ncbi:RHS repeat-associated core domain-containing protein [Chryseobacterium shandongense]|uniref:RHS repeat-associated core domain-containing protein n=1 Tax=Chryseobacterium shandongense TaxID=1493872 RepID=UPI000F4FD227|nr:RHS repeat-associated core domain-containing protein [Chryseobacterium shandongense]AZA56355.1 type IV secretion protein Rhs [Chryseobacterium shandongense]